MKHPSIPDLNPQETSDVVRRAMRAGRRRLAVRYVVSGVAAVVLIAGVGAGVLSLADLDRRASQPAGTPSISRVATPPASPAASEFRGPDDVDPAVAEAIQGVTQRYFPEATLVPPILDDESVLEKKLPYEGGGHFYRLPFYVEDGDEMSNGFLEVRFDPDGLPPRDDGYRRIAADPDIWFKTVIDRQTIGDEELREVIWVRHESGDVRLILTNVHWVPKDDHAPDEWGLPRTEEEIVRILSSDDWDPLLEAIARQ